MKTTGKIRSPFLAVLLALLPVIGNAGVDIEQTPLMVAEPVAPNIMFILDDSGSMGWEHMPGTTANWYNGPVGGLPKTVSVNDIRLRASNINTMWYNPLVTYQPWLKHDGSSYGNANYNAEMSVDPSGSAASGKINLQTILNGWVTLTNNTWNPSATLTATNIYSLNNQVYVASSTGTGNNKTLGLANTYTYTIGRSNYTGKTTSFYWRYGGFYYLTGSTETNVQDYSRYDFAFIDGTSWKARKCALNTNGTASSCSELPSFDWTPYGGTTRTVQQELQNYANWFVYYRLRINMAKAAASREFSKLGSGYRIGFDSLQYNSKSTTPVFPIPVTDNDGKFEGVNKENWFSKLMAADAYNGTSLREALGRSGEYFSDNTTTYNDSAGPYGPKSGSNRLSCRANFAILTTDGYWNGNAATNSDANADNDGSPGTEITGVNDQKYTYVVASPYKDGTNDRANTLADVAMYYWKNDLVTGLTNNVPVTANNPAFWQHMRTYGISIGEKGTLTPNQDTLDEIKNGNKDWPAPSNDQPANIDDLWHATVNSRGKFVVASNPDEFSQALNDTLNEIANETKSEASGSVNSPQLKAGSKVYFSRYTSGRWDGDVFAYAIDPATGLQDQSSTVWEASAELLAWTSRNIKVNASSTGVELKSFEYGNLNAAQQAILTQNQVNYLRGDRNQEESNGGTLRDRTGVLPAFINSQPVYVAEPILKKDFARYSFSGASAYAAYADDDDIKDRTPMLYIAGNNGMLHAFEAATGIEKFVFLPNFSIGTKLKKYSDPDYGSNTIAGNPHQYILDGELTIADAYILTGGIYQWRTILVGTQGRGGNGVFALDITDPDDIKLLWETTDSVLGNNLGKPIIAQVADKDWRVILGNGPNSNGDEARLVMIKLDDGTVTNVPTGVGGDNGLAAPTVWDSDGDGIFETAYAGDLKGNIWRFSSLGGTATSNKLFTAQADQPITAAPLVVVNQKTNATWIFVGTGSYLNNADLVNTDKQSWYGLIDDGSNNITYTQLLKRELEASEEGKGAVLEEGRESDIVNDPNGHNRGWYIDFEHSGERMIMTPNYVLGGALFAFSFTPEVADPCEPKGSSALWGIQPFSGSRLNQGIFLDGSGNPLKIDGSTYASVLYGIPVVTSGSPPITLDDNGKFAIHLPEGSILGLLPSGEPRRQSWREVVGP